MYLPTGTLPSAIAMLFASFRFLRPVTAVKTQVAEGSNEVGTVYYSDTYGLEESWTSFRSSAMI